MGDFPLMFSCPKNLGFIKTVYCLGPLLGEERSGLQRREALPSLTLQAFAFPIRRQARRLSFGLYLGRKNTCLVERNGQLPWGRAAGRKGRYLELRARPTRCRRPTPNTRLCVKDGQNEPEAAWEAEQRPGPGLLSGGAGGLDQAAGQSSMVLLEARGLVFESQACTLRLVWLFLYS